MNKNLKYINIAMQMGASIGLLTYLGVYLDKKFGNIQPWFTIFLALVAIIGSIIKLIFDLKEDETENQDTN
jgi:ATP synthase protein I